MWKEVEDLRKRVEALEAPIARRMELSSAVPKVAPKLEGPAPVALPEPKAVKPAEFKPGSVAHEDPTISLLKHHGRMNIIDLNASLKELGVNESVRDTLFKRMKPFMDKGVVKFDEKTQTFFIG